MKKINLKTVMMAILMMAVGVGSYAQISKVEIVATGLTCSMCSRAINNHLRTLSAVDSIATDLNTNTFIVYLKKSNTVTPMMIKDKVEKAGFFVGSMVVTMSFENQKINENLSIDKEGLKLIFVDTKAKVLNGLTKLRIVDKGFVTQKEYKKLVRSLSRYPSCAVRNEEDYHLIVI